MKRSVTGFAAAALLVPAAALAQSTVTPVAAPQGGGTYRMVAGAVEAKTTTDRPYSADAITEMVQVLPDGNSIKRSNRTRTYRDSAGRTRRESYDSNGELRSVSISDPVAKVNYQLDPAKKIAFRTAGNILTPIVASPSAIGGGGGRGGGGGGGAVARGRIEGGAVAPQAVPAVGGGGGGRGGMVSRTPAPENPNVKKEDLGVQNVEGVNATGTRTTTVIPAGEIGNTQEIRVVSEQWFSDELQVLVMTRHTDPRSGENTYMLKNIQRFEPDSSLFAPPPDYTIQERGIRRPQ